jgi:hypothetical protein
LAGSLPSQPGVQSSALKALLLAFAVNSRWTLDEGWILSQAVQRVSEVAAARDKSAKMTSKNGKMQPTQRYRHLMEADCEKL